MHSSTTTSLLGEMLRCRCCLLQKRSFLCAMLVFVASTLGFCLSSALMAQALLSRSSSPPRVNSFLRHPRCSSSSSSIESAGHQRGTAFPASLDDQLDELGPGTTATDTSLWSLDKCLREYQSDKENVVFLDATWFHKGSRSGRNEYLEGPRLPGAQYWDIVDLSCSFDLFPDQNPKQLFSMFPPEALVAAAFDWMKITPQSTLIVYGREGARFTPRLWYTLKQYCVPEQRIGLMQGSLEEWIHRGGPVDKGSLDESLHICNATELVRNKAKTLYPVSPLAREQIVDMEFVLSALEKNTSPLILDTRGSSFAKKGRIPGAIHVPYSCLTVDDSTIRFQSKEDIVDILKQRMGDERYKRLQEEPAILTCGSAVSVCHLALLFKELGLPEPFVYDGSWNEWGKDPTTPKET